MPKRDKTGVNKYENPQKIDRFTSNGYGIVGGSVSPERKKAVAQIQKELDAKAAKKPAPKKK